MLMIQLLPTKDDRFAAATEINADLNRTYLWGQKWNIYFALDKCYSLFVSLKKDVDLHPPLYMDALSIAEVDVLKSLVFKNLLGNNQSISYSFLPTLQCYL